MSIKQSAERRKLNGGSHCFLNSSIFTKLPITIWKNTKSDISIITIHNANLNVLF